jgi:DNA-binding CsgD family transcriptional regulator
VSFDELIYALHAGSSVRETQDAFLRHAADVLPARAHGIYQLDPLTRQPLLVQTRGVSDAFLSAYEGVGRTIDPLLARVTTERDVFCSDLDFTARSWRAHPFYEIVAYGGIHRVMQAPIVCDGELVGTLNVATAGRDRPLGRELRDRVRVVARHMSLVYARVLREAETQRRQTLAERILDMLNMPLVATDRDGTVLFSNAAAAQLLRRSDCAHVLREHAAQLRNGRRVVVAEVPIARGEARFPARRRAQGESVSMSIRSTLLAGGGAVLSFLYERPAAVAVQLPILTPREREIVDLVVRGLDNGQIAAAASISRNTVKQHLKRVFGKLDVSSRAELAGAVVRAGADPFTQA